MVSAWKRGELGDPLLTVSSPRTEAGTWSPQAVPHKLEL